MPEQPTSSPQGKKLLDVVRDVLRTKHYSYRTEQTYVDWIKRYILFHQKRHPNDMGAPEIQAFIIHLATERKVAASAVISGNRSRSARPRCGLKRNGPPNVDNSNRADEG